MTTYNHTAVSPYDLRRGMLDELWTPKLRTRAAAEAFAAIPRHLFTP